MRSAEQFWMKVGDGNLLRTDECWEWQAYKWKGYGRGRWQGRLQGAHRIAYKILVGPIPEGLQIDHLCRNKGCVNPSHLETVTNLENTIRGENFIAYHVKATHCAKGHPFNETNTYKHQGRTQRICRACKFEEQRRRRARQKAARTVSVTSGSAEGGKAGCLVNWH